MKKIITLGTTALLAVTLVGCGNSNAKSKNNLSLNIEKSSVKLGNDQTADVNFSTNKGAKYKVLDKDNNLKQIGKTYTTKTGEATLTLNSSGHYRLEVTKDGVIKDKDFTVKDSKAKSETLSFGKSDYLGSGNEIVEITVNSVKQVDSEDSMVVDVSSNDPDTKQFAIVSYTIKAIKGDISLEDFDGSNLTIADSKNTIGSISSNRDNGVPDTLSKGQSVTLRIGVGFNNPSNTATVKFGDDTWTGNITK